MRGSTVLSAVAIDEEHPVPNSRLTTTSAPRRSTVARTSSEDPPRTQIS